MRKTELPARLEETLTACWENYQEMLLALPPGQLIERAAEIAAARFCYDELTELGGFFPEYLLEHLLQFDDPLEAMREQWMNEQAADVSEDFERALWSLREHGAAPEEAPAMGGITMK